MRRRNRLIRLMDNFIIVILIFYLISASFLGSSLVYQFLDGGNAPRGDIT